MPHPSYANGMPGFAMPAGMTKEQFQASLGQMQTRPGKVGEKIGRWSDEEQAAFVDGVVALRKSSADRPSQRAPPDPLRRGTQDDVD